MGIDIDMEEADAAFIIRSHLYASFMNASFYLLPYDASMSPRIIKKLQERILHFKD